MAPRRDNYSDCLLLRNHVSQSGGHKLVSPIASDISPRSRSIPVQLLCRAPRSLHMGFGSRKDLCGVQSLDAFLLSGNDGCFNVRHGVAIDQDGPPSTDTHSHEYFEAH